MFFGIVENDSVWATTFPPETIEQTMYFGGLTQIIRDRYYMESTIPREEA